MAYIEYLEWLARCMSCQQKGTCTLRDLNANQRAQASCYRPEAPHKTGTLRNASIKNANVVVDRANNTVTVTIRNNFKYKKGY